MRLATNHSTRRALIAGGVIILLLLALLPLALGTQAQRTYQDLLRATLDQLPNGWIVQEQYDRGWFNAQARTELTLPPDRNRSPGSGPNHILLVSHIDHGPWAWATGSFNAGPFPTLTLVHTRMEFDGGPITLPPLLITTHIGTDGSGLSHLSIPATDQSAGSGGERLLSNEISGTIHHRLDPSQLVADLLIPAIALLSPAGPVFSLADARLRADLSGGSDGVVTGHVGLEVGAAQIGQRAQNDRSGRDVFLERLTMTLEQEATGKAPRQRLNLHLSVAANNARLGNIDYRSPVIGLSGQSLDWPALIEVGNALRTLASDGLPPAMRGLAGATLFTQLLPRFLATGPSITLEPFTLNTPDGPVAAHLALGIAAQDPAAQSPGDVLGALLSVVGGNWLINLKGDGALSLPQSVARDWIERADPKSATSPADQLQAWIDKGWLTADHGRVSSSLRIGDGQLTINGNSLPLLPTFGR